MANKKPKRKYSNATMIVIVILIVILAVAGAVYIDTFYGNGRLQSSVTNIFQSDGTDDAPQTPTYSLQNSMAIDENTKTSFVSFEKKFLLCTRDGVKFFNGMGDQKWNDTFNMTAPQVLQEGLFAAVGDMGAKVLRVYNQEGPVYSLQFEGTLMQFALNENGYLSVILKVDNSYQVQVYNASGTLLKGRAEESEGIYPLYSDVSDDNQAFAVSYIDTTDIEPIARVNFFYINPQSSESYTDSLFAAVEKTGEIIPQIAFMKGGGLAAISDQNIYGIGGDGKERWSYALRNTLSHASLANKEYIVLALGESSANQDGRKKGTISFIDANGRESASYESKLTITYLRASEKGAMIGNGSDFVGVKYNGREAWQYHATAAVTDIVPLDSLNKALVVTKELAVVTDIATIQTKSTTNDANDANDANDVDGENDANGDGTDGQVSDDTGAGDTGADTPEQP